MKANTTAQSLEKLQSLYASVKSVTENLLADFSDEKLTESLSERAKLLDQISREEQNVNGALSRPEFIDIKSKIRNLILSITELDKAVSLRIKAEMEEVQSELTRLSSKSNAALAYSVHRRI